MARGWRRGMVLRAAAALAAGLSVLALALQPAGAREWWVTPRGGPGYDGAGSKVADQTDSYLNVVPRLVAGDVLNLLADSADPAKARPYDQPIVIQFKGGPLDQPVVIRGIGSRSRIVGRSIEALRNCRAPASIEEARCPRPGPPAGTVSPSNDLLDGILDVTPTIVSLRFQGLGQTGTLTAPAFGEGRLRSAACIDLKELGAIVIENLSFENCWLTAVRAVDVRNVTLRRSLIRGSTYGLAARGARSSVTVEDVTWVQDDSGYGLIAKDGPQRCDDGRSTDYGCAGAMWRRIPWGSSRHGTYEHWNGALLGGFDIGGRVLFRRNKVLSAYNGIRLKADACESWPASQLSAKSCPYNNDIWIYDNVFSYIRDNPVQLEVWATNARIFRNAIHNAHVWFALDGMAGGPVYIYGNRGWFDDMPVVASSRRPTGGACEWKPTARPAKAPAAYDPALDRRFDYRGSRWFAVGLYSHRRGDGKAGDSWMDPDEQRCEQSLVGRVVKLALPPKDAEPGTPFHYASAAPIYMFNNSWFLRAPITGTGAAANLRHWNNAIAFCEPGMPGYDKTLCNAKTDADASPRCGAEFLKSDDLTRYPAEEGDVPFFDCFRWLPYDEAGKDRPDLASSFDYDVSANGFPLMLRAKDQGFEANGRKGAPGFTDAAKGDFTLAKDALAATSACKVEVGADGALACAKVDPATSFAGAFAPDGRRYSGPEGQAFEPPP